MKVKVILMSFILIGISYTGLHLFLKDSKASLTEKEARDLAAELYGGKVLAAAQDNDDYHIELENNKGVYQVVVDGESRKVSTIELIKRKQENTAITAVNEIESNNNAEAITDENPKADASNAQTNKGKATANSKDRSTVISEQKAKEIAQQQAEGKIIGTDKVTLKESEHYKVSIDRPSEVVHIYVQANTGKVSSFSSVLKRTANSDDDDDKDDEDDNDDDDDDADDNNQDDDD